MEDRTAAAPIRMAARIVLLIAIAAILTVVAAAQTPPSTTGKPRSQPDLLQTPSAAKTAPVKRMRSCSSYGDGFVYDPGPDTCVKAGGYLSIDAGGSSR
jgi:hypothetical protein